MERVKKLMALAERGVGGEAVNARAILDDVLRRNGISLDDLCEEKKDMHGFGFRDGIEKRLLIQVLATVCGKALHMYRNRFERKVFAEVTGSELVEIELLFDFHRRQFAKESDVFYTAYLHRHHLFPRDCVVSEDQPNAYDLERIEKIVKLMRGMDDVSARRQIGRGSGGDHA